MNRRAYGRKEMCGLNFRTNYFVEKYPPPKKKDRELFSAFMELENVYVKINGKIYQMSLGLYSVGECYLGGMR